MAECHECPPCVAAMHRKWARELQEVRRRCMDNKHPLGRFDKLNMEKLKRIQDEIYDLSEGQGQ